MNRILRELRRYIEYKVEYFGRPAAFPRWCNTGAEEEREDVRHFLDGEQCVVWDVTKDKHLPHADHIEMSGFYCSAILSYQIDKDGTYRLQRHVVFPMLRKIPNDTGGSLSHNFPASVMPTIWIDGVKIDRESVTTVVIDGCLTFQNDTQQGVSLEHMYFPAPEQPALIEKLTLKNVGQTPKAIHISQGSYLHQTPKDKGVLGVYALRAGLADADGNYDSQSSRPHHVELEPGEQTAVYSVCCGLREGENLSFSAIQQEQKRRQYIEEMKASLILETPDPILNTAFSFAKIRTCESIFKTKNGLMHAPGGGSYYAALWTNDQCEYANPFFPFVGYQPGCEEAVNCYTLYKNRMDKDMKQALVTSIVAEGDDFWNGAGDRGDGAMYAYGVSRFLLANADRQAAEALWDGLVWAIEFSLRKKNSRGVIASDSDELENRFPSGDANLFTSCLLYDALHSTALLGKELGKSAEFIARCEAERDALHKAIETTFGDTVEGFETYRYYVGNTILRAWICVPLAMGIFDRADETVKALLSERLWTKDGLRTQAGCDTFWDRATLYALRGIFLCGKRDVALELLSAYSKRRLLGNHVPYAIEAWPEGNQRHLAAESALYARIYTEGLFGIRPTGFHSFSLTPQLPSGWEIMALRRVKAFGVCFDIEVRRQGEQQSIAVRSENSRELRFACAIGETVQVALTTED